VRVEANADRIPPANGDVKSLNPFMLLIIRICPT